MVEAIPFIFALWPASTADESPAPCIDGAPIATNPAKITITHKSKACLHIPHHRKRKVERGRRAVGAVLVFAGRALRNPKSLIHCLSGFWGPDFAF